MAVREYSLRKDGDTRLSENFRVREFASHDGSDKILIAEALVSLLQQLRDHFQVPVTINSGYRTPAHNQAVGGASNSLHLRGMAADIVVRGITPLAIARQAERMNISGIGLYQRFVHLDTRSNRLRWHNRNNQMQVVVGFGDSLYSTTPAANQLSAMPGAAGGGFSSLVDIGDFIAERIFTVDNQERTLRTILARDENYVHLRDLMAALGGRVDFLAAEQRVLINSASEKI